MSNVEELFRVAIDIVNNSIATSPRKNETVKLLTATVNSSANDKTKLQQMSYCLYSFLTQS